tara:strand:- start:365 stop:1576 length:1212 start_codon:yes stop_codon:yes gene_type:complete
MVSVGIIGTAAYGVTRFHENTAKTRQRIGLRSVQESIANDVENKLQTPTAIYISLFNTDNKDLINCVIGTEKECSGKHTRIPKSDNDRNYFTLMYPTSEATSEAMSGDIYYSNRGKRNCKPKDPTCIFQVKTFFYATCPEGVEIIADAFATKTGERPSKCQRAEEIHLGYRVIQKKLYSGSERTKKSSQSKQSGKVLPPIPKHVYYYTIPIAQILGPKLNSKCNPGAIVSGYDGSGEATCLCTSPYVPSGDYNARGEVCAEVTMEELTCPPGEVFRGLDELGLPLCFNQEDAYDCQIKEGAEFWNSDGGCGSEYWIRLHQRSQCAIHCTIGKGGGSCNADEANGEGYASIKLNIEMLEKEDRESLMHTAKDKGDVRGREFDGLVKQGFFCEQNIIKCCRPKYL